MEKKEQCFIITPIGDDTDPIRRHIDGIIEAAITPALGDDYEIIVAHKMGDLGSITKQVIDKVYHSKLVIANLTNRNPNVMYELALRHATGKPAIMIAEKGTPLPSDIIMQRTIFYHNDAQGVLELRDALKESARKIDFEKKTGPIMEVLGAISHDADVLKKAAARDSNSREPLEYIMRRLDGIASSIGSCNTPKQKEHRMDTIVLFWKGGDGSNEQLLAHLINKRLAEIQCEITNFCIYENEIHIWVYYPVTLTAPALAHIISDELKKTNIVVYDYEVR